LLHLILRKVVKCVLTWKTCFFSLSLSFQHFVHTMVSLVQKFTVCEGPFWCVAVSRFGRKTKPKIVLLFYIDRTQWSRHSKCLIYDKKLWGRDLFSKKTFLFVLWLFTFQKILGRREAILDEGKETIKLVSCCWKIQLKITLNLNIFSPLAWLYKFKQALTSWVWCLTIAFFNFFPCWPSRLKNIMKLWAYLRWYKIKHITCDLS